MEYQTQIGNHKLSIKENFLFLDGQKINAELFPYTDTQVFINNVKRNEDKLLELIERMERAKQVIETSNLNEKIQRLIEQIRNSPELDIGDLVTYEVCTEVIPFSNGSTQFNTANFTLLINDRRNVSCFVKKVAEILDNLMNFTTFQIIESETSITLAMNGHDIVTLDKPEFKIEKVLSFFNQITKKSIEAVEKLTLLLQIYTIMKAKKEYEFTKNTLEDRLVEIAENSFTVENEYKLQD